MFKFLKRKGTTKTYNETSTNKQLPKKTKDIQKEIAAYEKVLCIYGINFKTLTKIAPSAVDTKNMLIDISKRIVEEEALMKTLHNERKLPITEIVETFEVDKKVIKKNAQYLIAIVLLQIGKYSGIREVMRV